MGTATASTSTSGSSSVKTSTSSSNSSSGTYSQSLVSQMSGLDVNSMVNQMMASDQVRLNQLLSQQQTTQWTQDRYRNVISNLNTFSGNYFDVLSGNYMLNPNSYSVYNANSTNTSAVTASVSNSANAGTYTVSSASLATAANVTGATIIPSGSTSTIPSSSTFTTATGLTGTISFSINGKSVTNYDPSGKTISQVMSDLSSQTGANFSYSELTGKFSVTTSGTGTTSSLALAYDPTDSNTSNFLNTLFGIGTGATATNQATINGANSATYTTTGKNGQFTITEPNGSTNTVTESSNQFTLDGVNYNFTANIANSSPVNINVGMDVSSVVTKIQNFVNDYNNLIGGVQDALNEKKNYSYQPLTAQQQSQMTDTQITQWNQQAQQGLLANDDTLNNMLTSMREAFYTPVQGNSLTMAAVGLSTSDDPTQGGKLTLDVNKLTAALQNNPQQVINLFTQKSTSVTSYSPELTNSQLSTRSSEEGIFQRLSDIEQEYAGTMPDANGNEGILVMKAGVPGDLSETKNTLYKQLKDEVDAVNQYKLTMSDDQTRYTNMFTQLQTAMSQLSSQQSYLSSMLSSSSSG